MFVPTIKTASRKATKVRVHLGSYMYLMLHLGIRPYLCVEILNPDMLRKGFA